MLGHCFAKETALGIAFFLGCGNGGFPQLTASPDLRVTLGPLLLDALGP